MTSALNLPVAKELSGGQPYMTESSVPSADTRTLIILAFSATAGVLVEFYDFAIFGFAAASAFPQIFFPSCHQHKPWSFPTWHMQPGTPHAYSAPSFSGTLVTGPGASSRS